LKFCLIVSDFDLRVSDLFNWMSSIPPNIIGSLFQAQVSAAQNAKETDAQRNKRLRDARELARLADYQTHDVEDADQAEALRVHREDEEQRDGRDAQDTWEQHHQSDSPESARPFEESPKSSPDDAIPSEIPNLAPSEAEGSKIQNPKSTLPGQNPKSKIQNPKSDPHIDLSA
jgi:hypothetical protein